MNIKQFIEFLQTIPQDATVQAGAMNAPHRQRWTSVSSIGSDG